MSQAQPARSVGRVHPASVAPAAARGRGRRAKPAASSRASNRTDRLQAFGRYAVWAIPVYAIAAVAFPRPSGAFSSDPATYARYLATAHGTISEWARIIGLGVLGVLSLVALAALLIKARGRWLALVGLLAGLGGSVLLILEAGSVVIRNERMRDAVLSGDVTRIHGNAQATSWLVPLGLLLLTLGWVLLGIAVFVARGLNRTDGVLLVISAPMIYIGGLVLSMIPVLGAFLLVAAGLGIGFAAGKVQPAGIIPTPPLGIGQTQSALARFVDAPDELDPMPVTTAAPREPAADDTAGTAKRLRGVPTSWSVTRATTDDLVAPPPGVPTSAKNLKPIATTKRNGSILNGASIKTTTMNGRPAGDEPGPADPPSAAQQRAENARRDKARNRTYPGGPSKPGSKPDRQA
jgi:Amt family ammonium transporter